MQQNQNRAASHMIGARDWGSKLNPSDSTAAPQHGGAAGTQNPGASVTRAGSGMEQRVQVGSDSLLCETVCFLRHSLASFSSEPS